MNSTQQIPDEPVVGSIHYCGKSPNHEHAFTLESLPLKCEYCYARQTPEHEEYLQKVYEKRRKAYEKSAKPGKTN